MSRCGRAIFLSYASQDADAAKRICDALVSAGLEVWLDQGELRGGDAWDASIRSRIKECALFLPIISANTEARSEGYFRLEWKLAVDRSHLMADDEPFLLPVVIDATPEASARVPDAFRARHWLRLPQGQPTAEFVARVRKLMDTSREAVGRGGAPAQARDTRSHRFMPTAGTRIALSSGWSAPLINVTRESRYSGRT